MADPLVFETRLWFDPIDEDLKFLPEGPRVCDSQLVSWVAIQHGPEACVGSLNLMWLGANLEIANHQRFVLEGRPGFAFPTTIDGQFLIGLERRLVLYETRSGSSHPVSDQVDRHVEGTIINDAQMFEEGVIFGTKDLKFATPKAGLYLYRSRDEALMLLRDQQTCSNGKVLIRRDSNLWTLLDIDTPRKQIVQYRLDVAQASVAEERVVVDLRDDTAFPDGMVAAPDGQSVLVAMYNPNPAPWGEIRQYSIATGKCEAIWRVPDSPQVTCPQLINSGRRIYLIVTTAIEHMPKERRAQSKYAGCLFLGETPWAGALDILRWDPNRRAAVSWQPADLR